MQTKIHIHLHKNTVHCICNRKRFGKQYECESRTKRMHVRTTTLRVS